jgi:sugar phosphate isomerase/epimerase
MEYGVQMYSVRDITNTDLKGALAAVARQGYAFVEFVGFFGGSAGEINQWLKENNLRVSGTHTGLKELLENLEETIAYHQAIGNPRIIIPYAELDCQAKIDAFVEHVNLLAPRLESAGIRLGYHNHSHEFKVNPDGSQAFEQLLYRTTLDLEIDTFWAYAAEVDSVALLDRIKARVPVIHIKDGYAGGEGMPLGRGTAPVKAVYEKAKALGIPMVVESETLTPSGLDETEICIGYLKSLENAAV